MRLRTAYRIMPVLLTLLTIGNAAVALRLWMHSDVQPNLCVTVVETPLATNVQSAVSAPLPRNGLLPAVDGFRDIHGETASTADLCRASSRWFQSYHYCVVNGHRYAIMNGERYVTGKTTAYGVISEIYPERIFLTNGDFIENQQKMEVIRNDNTGHSAAGE